MKRPVLRTLIRFSVFGLAAAVTLIVLFYTWTGYAGRREWQNTRDALIAQGELLSFSELAPPEIPDHLNFYAAPVWQVVFEPEAEGKPYQQLTEFFKDGMASPFQEERKPLADWTAELGFNSSAEIESRFPELAEFREAAGRPGARAPIEYQDYSTALRHIGMLPILSRAYGMLAVMKMKEGNAGAAAKDIGVIFRIADAQSTEPMLLSLFTRTNALVTAMSAFFQCSAIGRFDETDLRYFQQQFESAEIIENLALALRGERGMYNDFADRITGTWELFKDMHTTWARHDISMQSFAFLVYPFGYFYEDRARCNRGFAEAIAAVESRRVPDLGSMAPPAGLLYRGAFAELILPGIIEDYIPRIFDIQTQLRIAVTACAIERFRLATGRLPESLQELMPNYLPAIPVHPMSEEEVVYSHDGETYELSLPTFAKKPHRDTKDGRWVWR